MASISEDCDINESSFQCTSKFSQNQLLIESREKYIHRI